jgi:hypothetical protein
MSGTFVSDSFPRKERPWNRCDNCGKLVAFVEFWGGKAARLLATPDSDYSVETYCTICGDCNTKELS